MTTQEKLAALEDIMELDEGTLKPETSLDDIEEWDSLSALSFVVLLGDEFGRKITGQQIRDSKTVQDLLDVMEAEN
ncbi:phosphopantetheine-binding protein [uncultured Mailhella sp.]|uniref:acyl carrier protein n=1 Tax=uncultured Mailhella sp. TaxID=1981031 RepID=UPI002637D33C|nr:phosphopantetheine-binding protein [uncultured Mailhella sp.]